MNEARPDALLKSALEKIVYFEARSEQLQNDLASARADAERLKRELTETAQGEIELRRKVAEMEVTVTRSHRERHELGARIEALLQERTQLLSKLIDVSRIREAGEPAEGAGLDLAAFISELRGEVLAARAAKAQPPAYTRPGNGAVALSNGVPMSVTSAPSAALHPAGMRSGSGVQTSAHATTVVTAGNGMSAVAAVLTTDAPSAATTQAVRLRSEGRLLVSEDEVMALSSQGRIGRSEQTLFGFSIRELAAPDSAARVRACERLRALGDSAAAPALATALHGEQDPVVQVALLGTFAALAQAEGATVASPLLASPSPDVRIAALKAMMQLDPSRAAPQIAAASRDPDPSVRRRASLLALSLRGEDALRLSQETTHDRDPQVRRLTALALGASGRSTARESLLEFLADGDIRVRRAAAQSLGRLLGKDVTHLVTLDDAQRRREIRQLANLPLRQVRMEEVLGRGNTAAAAGDTDSSKEAAPPKPEPVTIEVLCGTVVAEIRCAIRGRTLAELARTAESREQEIEQACELLMARGQVIRRGLKYFTS